MRNMLMPCSKQIISAYSNSSRCPQKGKANILKWGVSSHELFPIGFICSAGVWRLLFTCHCFSKVITEGWPLNPGLQCCSKILPNAHRCCTKTTIHGPPSGREGFYSGHIINRMRETCRFYLTFHKYPLRLNLQAIHKFISFTASGFY